MRIIAQSHRNAKGIHSAFSGNSVVFPVISAGTLRLFRLCRQIPRPLPRLFPKAPADRAMPCFIAGRQTDPALRRHAAPAPGKAGGMGEGAEIRGCGFSSANSRSPRRRRICPAEESAAGPPGRYGPPPNFRSPSCIRRRARGAGRSPAGSALKAGSLGHTIRQTLPPPPAAAPFTPAQPFSLTTALPWSMVTKKGAPMKELFSFPICAQSLSEYASPEELQASWQPPGMQRH